MTKLGISRINTLSIGQAAILATGIAVAAFGLPAFVALAIGATIALLPARPLAMSESANGIGNRLMKASIVALGAGIHLGVVVEAGIDGLGATALTLGSAITIGLLIGRLLKVDQHVAILITVGTAICGGSAIAATAPAIRARGQDIGISLGVVFVLNAIALVLFPSIGQWLSLDASTFGQWSALAIHDTSSVVGAAAAHSPEALEIATVTKLARSLWIVPVVFIAARFVSTSGDGTRTKAPKFPGFIAAFVVLAGLVSLVPALQPAGSTVAAVGRRGLILALFFVGLGFSRQTIRSLGLRPLVLGAVLWVSLGLGSLLLLMRAG